MHVEGHIESGSGGTPYGPRRTNRTPIGSAGTDMGSGMMGNPTMGGNMMGGMTNGLMSGVSFMSEPLGGGSGGTTPRRTNRTPIGSAGTDMGSGTSSFASYGDLTGAVESNGSIMTPMGIQSSNRNINLPMSSASPINVNENTPNLQQIQSFPVVGTGPNGIHFHQDPINGQMYRMTQEFHQNLLPNYSSDLGTVNNLLNQIKNSKSNTPVKLLSLSERSYDSNVPIVVNSIANYTNLIDNSDVSFSKTSSSRTKAGNVMDYINTLPSSTGILKENEKDNQINRLSLVNDTSIQIKKDITVNKFADTSTQTISYQPLVSKTDIIINKFADTSAQTTTYQPLVYEIDIPVTKFGYMNVQTTFQPIVYGSSIKITRLV